MRMRRNRVWRMNSCGRLSGVENPCARASAITDSHAASSTQRMPSMSRSRAGTKRCSIWWKRSAGDAGTVPKRPRSTAVRQRAAHSRICLASALFINSGLPRHALRRRWIGCLRPGSRQGEHDRTALDRLLRLQSRRRTRRPDRTPPSGGPPVRPRGAQPRAKEGDVPCHRRSPRPAPGRTGKKCRSVPSLLLASSRCLAVTSEACVVAPPSPRRPTCSPGRSPRSS